MMNGSFGRLRRLALKELRETLRDRRTVVTLLLMPLLVYPLLSLVFRTFLLSGIVSVPDDRPIVFRVVLEHNLSAEQFEQWFAGMVDEAKRLESGDTPWLSDQLARTNPRLSRFGENEFKVGGEIEKAIADGLADAGVQFEFPKPFDASSDRPKVTIVFARNIDFSLDAADYLTAYLVAFNQSRWMQNPAARKVLLTLDQQSFEAKQKDKSAISFGTLIPLILVLMTITGAVYPAIDLTAGERERGTLEALVAAPIPRVRILIAKFLAVLTVAMLTATLNVIGMLVTVWAFRLENLIFKTGAPSPMAIVQVFGLLLLYAGFFSALLLAITSLARSFKEAQAYLIPLILLAMAPSVVSLAPGLTISGPLAIVPMVNFVLLARDIFQGQVAWVPCLIVLSSTLIYSAVALAVAARIFGTDAILYGSHESLKDALRRPSQPQAVATPFLALLCLALIFAANFLAISALSRVTDQPIEVQLLLMAVFTFACYIGLPYALALRQRISISSGFAVRGFGLGTLLAVLIMGVSIWPLTVFLITLTQQVLAWVSGDSAAQEFQQRLIAGGKDYITRWRMAPFILILLTHSFIPAVSEEWFFRGFLLQSLKSRWTGAWRPILFTGVAFGLFHLLAQSVIAADRLIPTTLMGILLGYVAWRSGSVIPGMILHTLHNGTVVSLAYFHDELSQIAWLPFTDTQVPFGWLVGISLMGVSGFLILIWSTANGKSRI